jgi:hypothetical protein
VGGGRASGAGVSGTDFARVTPGAGVGGTDFARVTPGAGVSGTDFARVTPGARVSGMDFARVTLGAGVGGNEAAIIRATRGSSCVSSSPCLIGTPADSEDRSTNGGSDSLRNHESASSPRLPPKWGTGRQRDRGKWGQRDSGTAGQRDRGTEGQRDKGTAGQRVKGQRDRETKGQRDSGTAGQRDGVRAASSAIQTVHARMSPGNSRGCAAGVRPALMAPPERARVPAPTRLGAARASRPRPAAARASRPRPAGPGIPEFCREERKSQLPEEVGCSYSQRPQDVWGRGPEAGFAQS